MEVLRKFNHILLSVCTFAFQYTVACLADYLLELISYLTHIAAQKLSLEIVYITQLTFVQSQQ